MSEVPRKAAAYDESEAEAFAERMAETVTAGAVTLMVSLGHKTGLFDTMAALPPSSAAEVAEAASLSERYVREWLAAMVTGGIVRYDLRGKTYSLPPEHAACLTRGAPLGNLGIAANSIPVVAAAHDRIAECFETGEGTHYRDYPCFHQMMAEDSAQTVVDQLFDSILPLDPALPARLEAGIDVLDAGCGSGRALIAMAKRYPRSRFTGYDLSAEAVAAARQAVKASGLTNLQVEERDLSDFDVEACYDLITTFDAVHDQKDPQGLLNALYRALRPGGVYIMQDIGGSAHLENNLEFPMAAYLYSVSCLHCMPVSLGQGGAGLGTMWGWETALEMLTTAGFAGPNRSQFDHDPLNVWFVSRKA